eukprot:TRINITY_DN2386_c3_g1_i1.p1 TRINITY_DN2386_c3_g1~~TRINITY_DN2386_c3_g1_i1.p1  ORF type:complete len:341 (-),score=64.61 TRINITY_DN2386_c3_g1_i1:360-1382(-)
MTCSLYVTNCRVWSLILICVLVGHDCARIEISNEQLQVEPAEARTSMKKREIQQKINEASASDEHGKDSELAHVGTAFTNVGTASKKVESEKVLPVDEQAIGSSLVEAKREQSDSEYWNNNLPAHYIWLKSLLWSISRLEASTLHCKDSSKKDVSPIFVVFGACPATFCGMQAVMFSARPSSRIDFWWVKPSKSQPSEMENNTLSKHVSGPHKNDPGSSQALYEKFANLFTSSSKGTDMQFGITQVAEASSGKKVPRAFIKKKSEKFWLVGVWQEEWTTNPMAWTKYIKGAIVYQKVLEGADSSKFYSRGYYLSNGKIDISSTENSAFDSPLPGEQIKAQ